MSKMYGTSPTQTVIGAVKRYIGDTSSFKNPECSFAKRESLREMLKSVQPTVKPRPDVGRLKFDLNKVSI